MTGRVFHTARMTMLLLLIPMLFVSTAASWDDDYIDGKVKFDFESDAASDAQRSFLGGL